MVRHTYYEHDTPANTVGVFDSEDKAKQACVDCFETFGDAKGGTKSLVWQWREGGQGQVQEARHGFAEAYIIQKLELNANHTIEWHREIGYFDSE